MAGNEEQGSNSGKAEKAGNGNLNMRNSGKFNEHRIIYKLCLRKDLHLKSYSHDRMVLAAAGRVDGGLAAKTVKTCSVVCLFVCM